MSDESPGQRSIVGGNENFEGPRQDRRIGITWSRRSKLCARKIPNTRRRASSAAKGKVTPPRRKSNRESRTREYLTPAEMETLLESAASGRYGNRDRTLLLVMYRHNLRVSETICLRWEHFDLKAALLLVQRLKHGGCPRPTPYAALNCVPCGNCVVRDRTARTCLSPNAADR